MTQKPRKGDFEELKSQQFPGGARPQTSVELGNRSVFILDPHLNITVQPFIFSLLVHPNIDPLENLSGINLMVLS